MDLLPKDTEVEYNLDLKEFKELYAMLAKRNAESAEENIVFWLTALQSFTLIFWIQHLKLTHEELEQFGYLEEIKVALQEVLVHDMIESVVYVGSNLAMLDQKLGLTIDAYKTALEIYKKKSNDPDNLKSKVVKAYEGKAEKYAVGMLESIPDEAIASRMMRIQNTFRGLNKKEKKYINKSLCTKKGLDECLVFDIADLHEKYLQIQKEEK